VGYNERRCYSASVLYPHENPDQMHRLGKEKGDAHDLITSPCTCSK
jgi:hypothetical protein